MKTIFAELYNKIMDFFQGDKGEQTSQCAVNRLQVILMHDRTKLDAVTMAKMREELIGVFSKYVIIDNDELEINLKSEGDSVALMLNIPIIRAKSEEELAEALKDDLKEEEDHSDETVDEIIEEEDLEENSEESSDKQEVHDSESEEDDDETIEESSEEEQDKNEDVKTENEDKKSK